jgi:predicted GIY-YIG superfamily endonuclease
MIKKKKEEYVTKEKCQKEALKYNTRGEFHDYSPSYYSKSLRSKWMDDICSHMIKIKNEKEYWTKEKCQEEALKYKTRGEYTKNRSPSYSKAWKQGWLDDICSHMLTVGNKYKKCIYSYEFLDTKTVYVGLTFNLNERNEQHSKRGPVFIYSQNNKITTFIQLTEYIDVEEAKVKEEFFVNKYLTEGWQVLNTAKTGAIGGGIRKWTLEKCILDAKKYKTKSDYRESTGYRAANRNKWLDIIYTECGFELNKSKPFNYWTKERCLLESEKYEKYKDFCKNSRVTYSLCGRHNWLNDIKQHRNW